MGQVLRPTIPVRACSNKPSAYAYWVPCVREGRGVCPNLANDALPCRAPAGQDSPLSPTISPEPLAHLPQHRLLPLLLQAQREQQQQEQLTLGSDALVMTLPCPALMAGSSGGPSGLLGGGAVSWGHTLVGVRPCRGVGAQAAGQGAPGSEGVEVEAEVAGPGATAAAGGGAGPGQGQGPGAGAGGAGGGSRLLLRCSYLVAADGAHSGVRGMLGGALQVRGRAVGLSPHVHVSVRGRAAPNGCPDLFVRTPCGSSPTLTRPSAALTGTSTQFRINRPPPLTPLSLSPATPSPCPACSRSTC